MTPGGWFTEAAIACTTMGIASFKPCCTCSLWHTFSTLPQHTIHTYFTGPNKSAPPTSSATMTKN